MRQWQEEDRERQVELAKLVKEASTGRLAATVLPVEGERGKFYVELKAVTGIRHETHTMRREYVGWLAFYNDALQGEFEFEFLQEVDLDVVEAVNTQLILIYGMTQLPDEEEYAEHFGEGAFEDVTGRAFPA